MNNKCVLCLILLSVVFVSGCVQNPSTNSTDVKKTALTDFGEIGKNPDKYMGKCIQIEGAYANFVDIGGFVEPELKDSNDYAIKICPALQRDWVEDKTYRITGIYTKGDCHQFTLFYSQYHISEQECNQTA